MGQYHQVYNKTKKETIDAHSIDNGAKLMEQVGWERSTSTALFLLLANSNGRGGGDAKDHPLVGAWAGDEIVVQGDYAEPDDISFVEMDGSWKDISEDVKDMLDKEFA